jgi:aminoglycoside 3-N-acetyltransferase
VDFDVCTALHYAEFSQETRTASPQGAALLAEKDGTRRWQIYDCVDMDSDTFPEIVKDYQGEVLEGKLGQADTKVTMMAPLVEFAVAWLRKDRNKK